MIINPQIKDEASWRNNEAKLYSDWITGSVCMKFNFYLYGIQTGHLKILVQNDGAYNDRVVFHRYGNHGHKWNFAQVYLDSNPTVAYQVLRSKFFCSLIHVIKIGSIF
jgi:hypothetical protein